MRIWGHICAKSWPNRMWGVVALPADELGPRVWNFMIWRLHFGIDWPKPQKRRSAHE